MSAYCPHLKDLCCFLLPLLMLIMNLSVTKDFDTFNINTTHQPTLYKNLFCLKYYQKVLNHTLAKYESLISRLLTPTVSVLHT